VESRWRAAGFDDLAFPAIAAEELERTPAHRSVSNDEIIDWCNRPGVDLPAQHDIEARFGDPPVTLFRAKGFAVIVDFWTTSTTGVHEHSFDGAFQVLSGSSLHTTYTFAETDRYDDYACAGRLEALAMKLLFPGATCAVASGADFIHALFHLDEPSSTILVRTNDNIKACTQREFHKPGLALDPFHKDPTGQRLAQIAALLCATNAPRRDAWLRRALGSVGPSDAYRILLSMMRAWGGRPRMTTEHLDDLMAPYLDLVAGSMGAWGPRVVASYERQRRTAALTHARGRVVDPEHRLLLALLLNATCPADVYRIVQERFPHDEPVAKVFGWVAALTTRGEALGIVLNATMLLIARRLAEGRTHDRIAGEVNARRRTPISGADVRAAEKELRGSVLEMLFP